MAVIFTIGLLIFFAGLWFIVGMSSPGVGGTCCVLFFSVSFNLLLEVLGFGLNRLGLMRNSERLGFPTSAALRKGRPAPG